LAFGNWESKGLHRSHEARDSFGSVIHANSLDWKLLIDARKNGLPHFANKRQEVRATNGTIGLLRVARTAVHHELVRDGRDNRQVDAHHSTLPAHEVRQDSRPINKRPGDDDLKVTPVARALSGNRFPQMVTSHGSLNGAHLSA